MQGRQAKKERLVSQSTKDKRGKTVTLDLRAQLGKKGQKGEVYGPKGDIFYECPSTYIAS